MEYLFISNMEIRYNLKSTRKRLYHPNMVDIVYYVRYNGNKWIVRVKMILSIIFVAKLVLYI